MATAKWAIKSLLVWRLLVRYSMKIARIFIFQSYNLNHSFLNYSFIGLCIFYCFDRGPYSQLEMDSPGTFTFQINFNQFGIIRTFARPSRPASFQIVIKTSNLANLKFSFFLNTTN